MSLLLIPRLDPIAQSGEVPGPVAPRQGDFVKPFVSTAFRPAHGSFTTVSVRLFARRCHAYVPTACAPVQRSGPEGSWKVTRFDEIATEPPIAAWRFRVIVKRFGVSARRHVPFSSAGVAPLTFVTYVPGAIPVAAAAGAARPAATTAGTTIFL